MIAANELRIGNWVYYGESIRAVTAIHDSPQRKCVGVDNMITELNIIKPIPLTPEIMRNSGFVVKLDCGICEHDALPVDINFKGNEFEAYINDEAGYKICDIQFVHQLQNLYFALTGQELEIKL